MDENREISSAPLASCEGRSVKAQSRTTDVHVLEKSDCAIEACELPEQGKATSCGEWGGNGAAGVVHHSGAHAPDSEREYACPSVWTVCVTQTAVWVCSALLILQKSRMRRRARTDLCGGRSVRIVPTATMTENRPIHRRRHRQRLADISRPPRPAVKATKLNCAKLAPKIKKVPYHATP